MARQGFPTTLATRALDQAKVAWSGHLFSYEKQGGTRHSAAQLGVDEHLLVKTLVFEDEDQRPLIVLMHGDCTVSAKELARQLGKKSIAPCAPEVAEKLTGYQVGGLSPFGLKRPLPIHAEATIFELPAIYINGGKRGFLVSFPPAELDRLLAPVRVSVANDKASGARVL
jgi:Cys-tRNA(Pro) deacylase